MCKAPPGDTGSPEQLNFETSDVALKRTVPVIHIDLVVLWKPEGVVLLRKKCERVKKWEVDMEMSWLPWSIWKWST